MLYLIGLGLNLKGISLESVECLRKCSKIYLEGYTVDFPYSVEELQQVVGKSILRLNRQEVENDRLIKEAKKENIALLVYGSPLFATTHLTLINDCNKNKVKIEIIYSASVFDAVAECGLELYKFGKITSLPSWIKGKYEPDSFAEIIRENLSIKAHTLILVDIGLSFDRALEQLKISAERKNIKLEKIVVCSRLGTERKRIISFLFSKLDKIKKDKIEAPFCFIIPSKDLHFTEKEALENFEI